MAETGIGQGFGQDLAHEQRLTQQMVQSLNVLQAQNADLAAMIRAELEENPLLEEVPSEREGEEGEAPAEESLDPGADEADWERMEAACALFDGRDDVWAATNLEICRYVLAFRALRGTGKQSQGGTK